MPAKPAKLSTKHPYAAVDHRVMDSEAYINLTYSAQALLLQIARQLNGHNNGHLQATFSYLGPRKFSENTISRGIAELIAHGMIYRARAGGYQQGPAKYAVTWLSICKITDGLFLGGFKIGAWRDWTPDKKTPPSNLRTANRKNGEWTGTTPPKIAVTPPPKIGDIECVPCRVVKAALSEPSNKQPAKGKDTGDPLKADDDYTRTRDDDQDAAQWDSDRGEYQHARHGRESATVLHRRSI